VTRFKSEMKYRTLLASPLRVHESLRNLWPDITRNESNGPER
jgi:hypothetical protein